ncbi:MAG TPA: RNA polymerase sigma factor [Candidatus Moranbacteria bacterium]|nr:RNA polymerase sigma factor [Candidatus Moranbacteria bacterium]
MSEEDKKIIEDFLTGKDEAFGELLKKYLKPVYNFLRIMVKDPDILDDLTQETFIKAWKNLRKFKPNKNFKTWIFTIAKNTALDYFKKKKTIPFSNFVNEEGNNHLENMQTDEILPLEILEKAEREKNFEKKLEELSADYRTILLLHYKEDFSLQEISEILDTSYNTIKSRHQRALLALKKILNLS